MKRITIMILFMALTALLTAGAVCADDISQENITAIEEPSDIAVDNQDILTEGNGDSTFTDLQANITDAATELSIIDDYAYDEATDTGLKGGIKINKNNFVINGNNHIIDAKGNAAIFNISGTNITISNLILKNANAPTYICGKDIATNNVTFINCIGAGRGGALYLINSTYTSAADTFTDNNAQYGAAIYAKSSNMTIVNGTFKSGEMIGWSLIYGSHTNMEIIGSNFTNTTSRYATAVYNYYGNITLKKSRFENLYANFTAGAVASKEIFRDTIDDCEFVNVSSRKNGGALFIDAGLSQDGAITIANSLFEDCTSDFGGAAVILSVALEMSYTTFGYNLATYNGGALYMSTVEGNITNCLFESNAVQYTFYGYPTYGGGAAYIDDSTMTVRDTVFTDNHAGNGGGLYFYDTKYDIDNLEFNGNGNAIYTFFDKEESRKGHISGSDEIRESDFNNIYYPSVMSGTGKQIILINNTVNVTDIPARYSLKEEGLLTPVKNQGSMASCWAFGVIAALESALLKATNVTYDFSENNMQNAMLTYSLYGAQGNYETATNINGLDYVLDWFGMFSQEYDDYDELGKISAIITTPEDIHIQGAVFVPYEPGNMESINTVKQAILKYGALAGQIFFDDPYYNSTTYGYYCPNTSYANHAICVAGWDDTYSKDNFNTPAPGDGAWIIKNSWGDKWGDKGLFYVSYYDPTLSPSEDKYSADCLIAFNIENTPSYNNNYEYDFAGMWTSEGQANECAYLNYFDAYEDDVIAAVGTFFAEENAPYKIEVTVNGKLVYTQTGKSRVFGYETIRLDKYVSIKRGDRFSVAITTNNLPMSILERVHLQYGSSQTYSYGKWSDATSSGAVRIKAYTLPEPFSSENINERYSVNKTFTVNVKAAGKTVIVSVNGQNITNVSDASGKATFRLPTLEPGFYTITTYFNGTAVINTINITSGIDAPDSVTVGYNSNAKITVKFYDVAGNPTSSVTVPVFNKIGSYKMSFTNYVTGETKEVTVNVVSRLSGNKNVEMYYDGANTYSVKAFGADGKAVGKNQVVTIKIAKKTFKVKTDANGVATLKIPNSITPGTYTISATYAGQTVKNTLKVKQVLKSKKTVKVKKKAKKLVLKATLKNGKKVIKGKKITFKFKGKTYKAKTSKKGVAKVKIGKKVIKKLKKGKKYPVKITYIKDTIKTNVKVK